MSLCACAKSWAVNDALNVKTVVLVSIDLLYNASNVDRLVASMAILTTFSIHRNGYLWASGENSDTTIQFFDSNFLSRCEISANLEVFPSDFCIFDAESTIMIMFTKFEVHMTIHCVIAAFDLTVVVHGGSCTQPFHQVWRSYYQFMSYTSLSWDTSEKCAIKRMPWTVANGERW